MTSFAAPLSSLATSILEELERNGVLLVHDRELPCVTAFVTGSPVAGSWWSHPMANPIYNALGELDELVLTAKLLCRKNTLVAKRLWPDFLAVVASGDPWQMVRLTDDSEALLDRINKSDGAILLDRSDAKAAEQLEQRLLVHTTEVHTESGAHRKALQSWPSWAAVRSLDFGTNPARSRGIFEELVGSLPANRLGKLLPW